MQRAVEVEVVDVRGTAGERAPEREAVERPARVAAGRAGVRVLGRERGDGARRRRRAGRDRDVAVQPPEHRQTATDVAREGAGRVVERRGERDVRRAGRRAQGLIAM